MDKNNNYEKENIEKINIKNKKIFKYNFQINKLKIKKNKYKNILFN